MDYENILYNVTDHIATITVNRPKVMNAISYQARNEIVDACEKVSADPEVWVCIITGAGDRAFSTGIDLKERAKEADDTSFFDRRRIRNRPSVYSQNQAIAMLEKPTIAAIRGYAVGGGLELALACDIRVAAEDAKLGMLEVRRGRLGGGGGTQRLPRLIGTARALELCLTGEPIGADEAFRIGLVNRVAPVERYMNVAREIAAKICLGAPLSVIAIKEAITKGAELPLEQGLKLENELGLALSTTEDQKEGSRAFAEKRPAMWKGR
jgi:enoyl-CoA hydratase/carnithine racemase